MKYHHERYCTVCVSRLAVDRTSPQPAIIFPQITEQNKNSNMAKSKKKVSLKRKAQAEAETGDLKRFAGSSGEEDNDDDEEVEEIENEIDQVDDENDEAVVGDEAAGDEADGEEEVDEVEVEDSEVEVEEDEEEAEEASGMANAMARILGTQTKKGTSHVVLSKTTTPMQRLQQAEKLALKEAKEKRKLNRDRNLTALHIPLSVATSHMSTGSTSLVTELNLERTHRRVATRGVVALFNAIAQHQNETKEVVTNTESSDKVKKMTKHGFLDMIKTTAKETTQSTKQETTTTAAKTTSKPQWNALQDNYLLDSKLKDWDKESSEEEDADADEPVDDTWDDGDAAADKKDDDKSKRGDDKSKSKRPDNKIKVASKSKAASKSKRPDKSKRRKS